MLKIFEMESYEEKIKLHNDLQRFQIEKSIVGSEAYNIEQDLMKGISQEEILEKARSGIYKPTKQNLKEGKAGQKYGEEKKEQTIDSLKKELHSLKNKEPEKEGKYAGKRVFTYQDKVKMKELEDKISSLEKQEYESKIGNYKD